MYFVVKTGKNFKIACDFTRGNLRETRGKMREFKNPPSIQPYTIFWRKNTFLEYFPRYPEVFPFHGSWPQELHSCTALSILHWSGRYLGRGRAGCSAQGPAIHPFIGFRSGTCLYAKKRMTEVGWFCWDGFGNI